MDKRPRASRIGQPRSRDTVILSDEAWVNALNTDLKNLVNEVCFELHYS